jgi:hypothetical protein
MQNMKALKKEQKRDIAALAKMKDSDIDLTAMPEVLVWSGAEVGKYYRKNQSGTRVRAERQRRRIRKAGL